MNFDLTEDQQMLADSVRQFVRKESPVSRVRKMREDANGWEKAMWKRLGEQGWLGILYPESLGGFGGSFPDMMLILQNMGTTLMNEPVIDSAVLGGLPILFAGSDEQQSQFLAKMIEGETSLALAFAERDSRNNMKNIVLKAEKDGDGYKLSGEKVWVPNGHAADQIVVAARTSGKVGDAEGISLFVVDKDTPGLTIRTVNGMDSHKYGMLTFDGAAVPAGRLLGQEGKGFPVLMRVLDYGAAAACAEGAGIVREMLEQTVGYLNTRKQFGVPIGSFQALQHRAVDMFVETELCVGMSMLAAIKVDSLDQVEREHAVSSAKAQLSIGGKYVSQQSLQLHGGIGVTDEHDIGLYFKRMHHLNILCGDEVFHTWRLSNLPGFEGEAA